MSRQITPRSSSHLTYVIGWANVRQLLRLEEIMFIRHAL
jgi:hypothetical protein